jgi:hypothetical protein
MLDYNYLIKEALRGHIRVNTSNKTVEIYDEHGVKMRLTNLSEDVYYAFKDNFQNF